MPRYVPPRPPYWFDDSFEPDDDFDPPFAREGTPPADPDENPQGISPAGWAIVDAALIDEPPIDPDATQPIQIPLRRDDE